MKIAKPIQNLADQFERLPGIGTKSALRLSYYLMHVPEHEIERFIRALGEIKTNIRECSECMNACEGEICEICADNKRNKKLICVVEQPMDVMAFENMGKYDGVYHVLHGLIDPLHNIGPDEIRIDELIKRINESGDCEVLLALDPTMEGETTCLYLKNQINGHALVDQKIRISRLAAGLPMGADIDYADTRTLDSAIAGRQDY